MRNTEKTITLQGDKCTDCKICELTCSAVRERGFNRGKARLHVERQDLLKVLLDICRLCAHPACVVACPTHAIEVADGLGIVSITPADCTACGLCVSACPHKALRLWPGRDVPAVCDL
ncbi:MAG: 4Fe-4S binding protein [Chloroflexi bacterium]|nr:4Fe-4S binding protein [Chloroflexota bacterium]